MAALLRAPERVPGQPLLDLRWIGLGNWSHALNQAIPLALAVRDALQQSGAEPPLCIVGRGTPSKVKALAAHFGLEVMISDRTVVGQHVSMQPRSNKLLNLHARSWLEPYGDDVDRLVGTSPDTGPNAGFEKVFLSRKQQRGLVNATEIGEALAARGFVTIYAEEHTLAEQMGFVLRAKEIVAIHGAALAPVLYRRAEHGPFRLIELFSPGHVVPLFRVLCEGLPLDYRAVRGIPDRRMAQDAFGARVDFSTFAQRHSLSPFAVDLDALTLALSDAPLAPFEMGAARTSYGVRAAP